MPLRFHHMSSMRERDLYYYQTVLACSGAKRRSCDGAKKRDAREARGEEEPQEEVQGYLSHKKQPCPRIISLCLQGYLAHKVRGF